MISPKKLNPRLILKAIALTEIVIGLGTISGILFSFVFSLPKKPPNIFAFVLISAVLSASLGIGLLFSKEWARKLLIFFSGWVILTKILVFMDVMQFSGEIITSIPNPLKNTISILYHGSVIILLHSAAFRKQFTP